MDIGVIRANKKMVILVVVYLLLLLLTAYVYYVDKRDSILMGFRSRVVGVELLDELVPQYSSKRVLVNEFMTVEEVFSRCSGDGARINWGLSSFFGRVDGKYHEKVYAVRVDVTRSCLSFRRFPEVKKYRVSFLYDVRDRKVRRLYSGWG